MAITDIVSGRSQQADPISQVVGELAENLAGRDLLNPGFAGVALGMESDPMIQENLSNSIATLDEVLDQLSAGMEADGRGGFGEHNKTAAKIGALLASNPAGYLGSEIQVPASAGNLHVVGEQAGTYTHGLEAYDERENARVLEFTAGFNLTVTSQDEFAEALFPIVVVGPDEDGLAVTTPAIQLYTDFTRSLSGTTDKPKYRLRKLQDAYLDASVLDYGSLRMYPVYDNATNAGKFYDPANTASTATVDGVSFQTAPLLAGENVSLLGISTNAALLASGTMDETDALDPFIRLEKVWVEVTTTAPGVAPFGLEVSALAGTTFVPGQQNHHRDTVLSFSSDSYVLGGNEFTNFVAASGITVTAATSIVLELSVSGTGNLETSDVNVYGSPVKLLAVYDANGNALDTAHADYVAINAAINGAPVKGYDLLFHRTNSNRRSRGKLAKVDRFRYLYPVVPVGPISVIKPHNDARSDAADLANLVAISKTKMNNDAVTALLDWANQLEVHLTAFQQTGVEPNIHSPAAYMVRPYFQRATIDVLADLDSLMSSNRRNDVRGVLMTYIADAVTQMISNSGYLHALNNYYGANAPKPTVIVATDGRTAGYLRDDGQVVSTVAGMYDLKVVTTTDTRMAGQMAVTLGIFDSNRNTQANPLNFGVCAYVPEVTVVVPITRNNSVSKELSVDPRYKHVAWLPVMSMFSIANLDAALTKVTLNNAI